MVGALTDLIVDGRVNTYRLQRNMVSGAIVGGAVGAAAGHQADQQEQKAKSRQQPSASLSNEETFKKQIGEKNYIALEYLISCNHKEAYRMTLQSSKSSQLDYELTAYAIQALIDRDRNNTSGETTALKRYIAKDKQIDSMDVAKNELGKLHAELQDERRIRGRNISCQ